MKKDEIQSERFDKLKKSCSPLRVKVSLHRIKDKYYIHLDGTMTYPHPKNWDEYWSGFDKYVNNMLRINGFLSNDVKIKKDCYAVAFIGSLFDFLKEQHN